MFSLSLATEALDADNTNLASLYYDLGFQLFGSLFAQISDNLVFYYVFRSIGKNFTRTQNVLLFLIVFLTMYCSWTLQYFIFPFFMNTNSTAFQPIAFWTSVIYVVFAGLYDLSFSIYFSYILVLDFMNIRKMSSVNKSFSIKFMIHFVFRYSLYELKLFSSYFIVQPLQH